VSAAHTARINPYGWQLKDAIRPSGRLLERHPLPAPRPGNPRRKPKGHTCAGALRPAPRRKARSLDNDKHLAISCNDEAKLTETKRDKYDFKVRENGKLLISVEKIFRSLEVSVHRLTETFPPGLEQEIQRLVFSSRLILEDQAEKDGKRNPTHEEIEIHALKRCTKSLVDLQPEEKLLIAKRLSLLQRQVRRWKDHQRIQDCQKQFVGFKATCCSSALAVPVGCNHRLCFLCNSHRAEKYRERVRSLFDRLEHPLFLTLTIPNLSNISKRTFSHFGAQFNKFRKLHSGWIKGGLRAIEVTYNESHPEKPWHVHAHVLIDGAAAPPLCKCPRKWDVTWGKYRREHSSACAFVRFKRRLEFDWLCLSQNRKSASERWRPADFDYWFAQTWSDFGGSPARRAEWNLHNRRILDIRRVTNRKKAAFEVLKYITKASAFAHNPRAVDEFITAVRGSRMLQTFGTWYGFKFEDNVNTWAHLECGCGKNDFERIGVFYREAVFMEPISGRWLLRDCVLNRGSSPP
jgi:Replication protein